MQYRRLGRTDLNVSVIGLGGLFFPSLSSVDTVKIIMRASELGINLVEVGRAYGGSEEKAGFVMQKKRNAFYIATKTPQRERNGAIDDINASLAALKTSYIDIYQLHQIDSLKELDAVLGPNGACKGLKLAKEQGKIKHTGITGHSPAVLEKAIGTGEFDTVQVLFSPVEREALSGLVPLAFELDVGIMGMKPFGGGAFLEKDSVLYKAMEKYDKSVTGAFLRFELSFSIASMLTGVKTIHQLEENAAVGCEFNPFSDAEIRSIVSDVENCGLRRGNVCHRCGYCLPCPQNINIPLFLRLDEYYSQYGSSDWPVMIYGYHVDNANLCKQCGLCEERCPFKLPIREMLKEAHQILSKK